MLNLSLCIVFCLALALDSIKNFSAQYDLARPFNAVPELKLQNYDKKRWKKLGTNCWQTFDKNQQEQAQKKDVTTLLWLNGTSFWKGGIRLPTLFSIFFSSFILSAIQQKDKSWKTSIFRENMSIKFNSRAFKFGFWAFTSGNHWSKYYQRYYQILMQTLWSCEFSPVVILGDLNKRQ